MKAVFSILKDKPNIKLTLTRDSVCAGDDCDAPHTKKVVVHSILDSVVFVKSVASGYLPSIAGAGHSWTCSLNGQRIGVVRSSGIDELIPQVSFLKENTVHFSYHSATY